MIVTRFPQFFGIRFPEWIGSLQAILVGVGLLHPYEGFANNPKAFHLLASVADENIWGIVILLVGVARFASLVVNGHRKKITTWSRVAAAVISCGIWTAFSVGLFATGVVSTWWGAWPIAALVEFVNIYRATHDARVAYGRS